MKIKGKEAVPTIFETESNDVVGILECRTKQTKHGIKFVNVLVWNFTKSRLQEYPCEEGCEKWKIFSGHLAIWN